jgi:hypothetical protein
METSRAARVGKESLFKNDPQLLESRMQMREREVAQRRIIKLS